MKNIFDAKASNWLPEKVTIVGCGASLAVGRNEGAYFAVDAFTIVVNAAIRILPFPNIWLCADLNLLTTEWFREVNEKIRKRPPGPSKSVRIFSEGLWVDGIAYEDCCYKFSEGRAMNFDDFEPERGALRPGATVSAQAVQLAYHFGVRHIELCGVDMYGNEGALPDNTYEDRPGPWPGTRRFSSLIRWIQCEGIKITTVTPTVLPIGSGEV